MLVVRRLGFANFKTLVPLYSMVSSSNQIPSFPLNSEKPCQNSVFPFIAVELYRFSNLFVRNFSSLPVNKTFRNFRSDGECDENSGGFLVCPGCGVFMQEDDPKLPGFFVKPSEKDRDYRARLDRNAVVADETEISISLKKGQLKDLAESYTSEDNVDSSDKPIVCARCHSLRHYGKVKDITVENLLPDFDFDHTIGKKLASASGSRSVVLMVVDAADFDGSFPRKVAKLVYDTIEEHSSSWKKGKSANIPRVVLVVTKIDLLPSFISPTTLEYWVRNRAREGGAVKLTSVHLVSAVKNWGLKNLIDDVRELVGERGNVWAIGAQNAGKSTLLNALGRTVGRKVTHLTEAPVPGTTLGIVRVDGILSNQAKLFDTPGILHPYQISTRLTREEQKMVYISKELKPRTYRIKAGHSVHISGLIRLDVEKTSVDTLYLTVWAFPLLPLHMGKTEHSCTMVESHFGHQLQPPIGVQRVEELGKWVRKELVVHGNSWEVSSMDVAAAGLGWFAIGLKGEAVLGVWTYDGIHVTLRSSLIPTRASNFESTGFTVSEIVSKADRVINKQKHKRDIKHNVMDEPISSAI